MTKILKAAAAHSTFRMKNDQKKAADHPSIADGMTDVIVLTQNPQGQTTYHIKHEQ